MKDYITGKLRLNKEFNLEIGDFYTLVDGAIFEINLNGTWVKTQFVGSKRGFYAYGLRGLELEGRIACVLL